MLKFRRRFAPDRRRESALAHLLSVLLIAGAAASEIPYRQLSEADFRIDESLKLPSIMQTAGFFHVTYGVRVEGAEGDVTARVISWRVRSGFDRAASGRISPKLWQGTSEQMAWFVAHEQGHLDINEVHANRLRRIGRPAAKGRTVREAKARLGARVLGLIEEAERRCQAHQDAYDGQTKNGTDKVAQERWLRLIADALHQSGQ